MSRYWWVNQNQTYVHEIQGQYLWSPKRKSNGHANPYYDFMREVSPGDVVFSFAGTYIKAIGIVASNGYEAPKPLEFGQTGAYWEKIGWRVDVIFHVLQMPIRPADHMDLLGPLLPSRYSPLRSNGAGLQNLYLTTLPLDFASRLVDVIGPEARGIIQGHIAAEQNNVSPAYGLVEWEQHELERVQSDDAVPETERRSIVMARRGQGLFKDRVLRIERSCRITGVNRVEHLRASHCKPWRDASNAERLDGENGLLLTPTIDHLFDRGFIGFDRNGDVLISPVAHADSLLRMGIDASRKINVGTFTAGQQEYLEFHRENVLLRSKFLV